MKGKDMFSAFTGYWYKKCCLKNCYAFLHNCGGGHLPTTFSVNSCDKFSSEFCTREKNFWLEACPFEEKDKSNTSDNSADGFWLGIWKLKAKLILRYKDCVVSVPCGSNSKLFLSDTYLIPLPSKWKCVCPKMSKPKGKMWKILFGRSENKIIKKHFWATSIRQGLLGFQALVPLQPTSPVWPASLIQSLQAAKQGMRGRSTKSENEPALVWLNQHDHHGERWKQKWLQTLLKSKVAWQVSPFWACCPPQHQATPLISTIS